MGSKERGVDRGSRFAARDLAAVGADIRTARVGRGLSLRTVGRAVGLSHSQVGRIERGEHQDASVRQLSQICQVVGLDLRVRTYPGGSPLRDAGQIALLERFAARLHRTLTFETEVPLSVEGDQRAWDAKVTGAADRSSVEAVTRVNDVQALLRRIALKQRDDGAPRVVLLLSDTSTNRAAIGQARALVEPSFPVSARVALAAFGAGRHPEGSAIVFL